MFKKLTIFSLFFLSFYTVLSQRLHRKSIRAVRVENPPKIDGILTDSCWGISEIAKNFIVISPNNGDKVSKEYSVEVNVVYDDNAVYISAKMFDPEPNKIPKEFAQRDNRGQSDYFSVTINPNDDGQNPFRYYVEASGNQLDAKVSNGEQDFNWSAVWESEVKITNYGWNVEMKIPYRALRFSNAPIQSWAFNFFRRIERKNTEFSWNFIDNSKGTWTQYDGLVTNFKNIQPSTRLNLYPYILGISSAYDGNTEWGWNAGLDIKYGLSENFTLDATLIPDFSQTAFDDVSLNLGPFEQKLTEQRPFFTEGTDLFAKGNLFYSRRIGGTPIANANISENETVIEYPEKVNMLNAIKISGRTKSGLGIGFFNAITEKTEAIIENKTTKKQRSQVVNPFSNYNISVLDYQFNKNSSVTLINTNVFRNGDFRDANATGLLWNIGTKNNKYSFSGATKMTHISDIEHPKTGYMLNVNFKKTAGNWFWELGYNLENKDYDPNDMGLLYSNNEQELIGSIGHRLLRTKGIFNRYRVQLQNSANFQHHSGVFTQNVIDLTYYAEFINRLSVGGSIGYSSVGKDFNEPRQGNVSGIYFNQPAEINLSSWISTSYLKKLAVDFRLYNKSYSNAPKHIYGFSFRPRYRFNNKFSLKYGVLMKKNNKNRGYLTKKHHQIIFAQRNESTLNNTITGKYSFNTKSSLSLTFRHNWTTVVYDGNYFSLQDNGNLLRVHYTDTNNLNYNRWNMDVSYVWEFAPGSQMMALYRNSINPDSNFASTDFNYFENINALFKKNMRHIFSLRIVYFIDYNKLKSMF